MRFNLLAIVLILSTFCCDQISSPIVNSRLVQIYGCIKESGTTLPIHGAVIISLNTGNSDTTNIQGYYFLDSLNSGIDTIIINANGYTTDTCEIEIAHDKQLDFFLEKSEEGESDLVLALGHHSSNVVLLFDPSSKMITDTFYVSNYICDLKSSMDGRYVFISTREGTVNRPGKVYLLNIAAKYCSMIFDRRADVYIAPQGTIFLLEKIAYESLRPIGVVDPYTFEIKFVDTLDIRDTGDNSQSIAFSQTDPVLYAISNSDKLFAYDYNTKNVLRTYENLTNPAHIYVPNENYLYDSSGRIFDLCQEYVISYLMTNQLGYWGFDHNSNKLYLTDPGIFVPPQPIPEGEILVFDTNSNSQVDVINVGRANSTERIQICSAKNIAFTHGLSSILIIDLEQKIPIDQIILEYQHISLRSIALANNTS